MDAGAEVQPGLAELVSELRGAPRATIKSVIEGENYHCIAIANIPLCPLKVACERSFVQLVVWFYWSVFRPATLWTPSTVIDAVRDGPVQCCDVGARLATRNDAKYRKTDGLFGHWSSGVVSRAP